MNAQNLDFQPQSNLQAQRIDRHGLPKYHNCSRNYVFKGAFFSLSAIRAGPVVCDLKRPRPSPSLSCRMQVVIIILPYSIILISAQLVTRQKKLQK